MDVLDLENNIASYLGRTVVTDLNPSNLTPTGINIDLGKIGLNSARRKAEQAHDFRFSETNAFLSIGSSGASLTNAYVSGTITVTGALSPNITGTWAVQGTMNGQPFYMIEVSTVQYFNFYSGSVWFISIGGFDISTNYWKQNTASQSPAGTYTPTGSPTGTATVAIGTALIGVKRVKYVSLPLSDGEYEVIEFLTSDQFQSRVRMQTGRQYFNPAKSLNVLGATGLVNPLCYQNGQTLYLSPSNLTFPQVAQLSIVQWLPDYVNSTDTDYFTLYGPEYMYWRGIYEVNNLFRRFSPRQEGNIDEDHVLAMADDCLQRFIAWDNSISAGTSEFVPPPVQPQAA